MHLTHMDWVAIWRWRFQKNGFDLIIKPVMSKEYKAFREALPKATSVDYTWHDVFRMSVIQNKCCFRRVPRYERKAFWVYKPQDGEVLAIDPSTKSPAWFRPIKQENGR